MRPFGRRRSAEGGDATGVVHRASRAEWRGVSPIAPVLSRAIATVDTAFERGLTTRAAVGFLEPLGHHVEPDAPAGVAGDLATVVPSTPRSFPPDPRSTALTTGSASSPVQAAAEPGPSAGAPSRAESEPAPTGVRSSAFDPPMRPTIDHPTMSRVQPAREPAAAAPGDIDVVVPRPRARSLLDAPPPPVSRLRLPNVAHAAESLTTDLDAGPALDSADSEEIPNEVAEPAPDAEPRKRPLIAQRAELPEFFDATTTRPAQPDRPSTKGSDTPARASRQATGSGSERPGPNVRIGAPFTSRPPAQPAGRRASDAGHATRNVAGGRSTVDLPVSAPSPSAQPDAMTSDAELGSSSSTVSDGRSTSADHIAQAARPALPAAPAPAPSVGDAPSLPLVGSPRRGETPTVLRRSDADAPAPRTSAESPAGGALSRHQRHESTDSRRGSDPGSDAEIVTASPTSRPPSGAPNVPTPAEPGRPAAPLVSLASGLAHSPEAPGMAAVDVRIPAPMPGIESQVSRSVAPSRGLAGPIVEHGPTPLRAGGAPPVARRLIAHRPPIGNPPVMTHPSDIATPGAPGPADGSSPVHARHRQSPSVQRAAVEHRGRPTTRASAASSSPRGVTVFATAADARASLGSHVEVAPFSPEPEPAAHPDASDVTVIQRQVDALPDATSPADGAEPAGAGAAAPLPLTPTGRSAGEPPSDEQVAELVRALYPSLHRRLTRDLLLDRERAGYRTDIRF